MSARIPGAREVEPEREHLRLVKNRATHRSYLLVLDEVHQIQAGDGTPPVFAHIVVTASKRGTVPVGLGAKIAAAVRGAWVPEEPDGA